MQSEFAEDGPKILLEVEDYRVEKININLWLSEGEKRYKLTTGGELNYLWMTICQYVDRTIGLNENRAGGPKERLKDIGLIKEGKPTDKLLQIAYELLPLKEEYKLKHRNDDLLSYQRII